MILLIDNYDSFSYNVYQLTASVEPDVKVIRNDEMTVEEIGELAPSHIILSPGPGRPSEAGICEEVIRTFQGQIPILGICLGHQAICEVFGATVTYARELMHGKQSTVMLDRSSALFRGMDREMVVARYHSLAADPETMPEELSVTAMTPDGEIMAVEHREHPIYGVQFHPESVLTPKGRRIMENFLQNETAGGRKSPLTDLSGFRGKTPDSAMESEENATDLTESDQSNIRENSEMIGEAIIRLSKKEDIGYEMAKAVMNEIMSGEATDIQKSAYLMGLSMKGETIEEITGSAEEMRNHALPVEHDMDVLEIVGTGGDGSNSFNISTTAALIVSAAGVPVAKHGNRAASSRSGAADCLEALGVNISVEPEKAAKLLKETGICFLFAQKYHTAMKYVGPIRKELGIRTVFNILGPLTNPARANMQVMGVYDENLLEPMAHVLSNLGVKKGMVVYGEEKLDEISICGPTKVVAFHRGEYKKYLITPEDVGLQRGQAGDLLGGTPQENAEITRAILTGEERGAKRDAAVINAAAALFVAGKANGMKAAVKLAEETIDSGKALRKLEEFVEASNR
ncbi:MAG: bifunctional anthranilate synthase component II/anthranilate phosphoribosyltransferase [Lachnospiraceae bacterium]|nr:bifunctional anthranilate synthase component II/anthranilate phosphoribosyltransferase [Butyrivibrio sp.]MCM1343430.1 bifunctional anthranilate synthase component II/anthranilate phosphoribosyltransferase [Muribaculaceae bacterium]MCM1412237.1 bifunctional anthranilate synthase component II/anthranilate phosphoribosyltransferase [Lachnospiraceae bacterium]